MQTNVLKKPIYIAEIDCAISSYTGQILNGLFPPACFAIVLHLHL